MFADFRVAHDYRVVHFELFVEGGDGVRGIVHGNAEDLEASGAVVILELDEVGDFGAAGFAPCGPEIEEDDFAVVVGEFERRASGRLRQGEIGSGFQLRGRCVWGAGYVEMGCVDGGDDEED